MNLGGADPGQEVGVRAFVEQLDVAVQLEVYRVDAAGVHVGEGRCGSGDRDGEEVRVNTSNEVEGSGIIMDFGAGDRVLSAEYLDR